MDIFGFITRCIYILKIYFISLNSASLHVSNATLTEAISYIVSKSYMKSAILYSDQNETLAKDIGDILDGKCVQRTRVNDITSMATVVENGMRKAIQYFTITEMQNVLNFIIVCNNTCVTNLLGTVKKSDLIYGRNIILRHYSRWIIVLLNEKNTAEVDGQLFDNILVLSLKQKMLNSAETTVLTSEKNMLTKLLILYEENLFPNMEYGMKGTELTVATLEWAPYMKERKTQNGTVDFVGIGRDILDGLASKFNFTYKFVKPDDKAWGSMQKNGTWNGIVGMLQKNVADFCTAPYGWNKERSKVMDFSYFINYDGYVAVYKTVPSPTEKWHFLTQSFQLTVYLYWSVVLTFMSILFILFEMVNVQNIETRSWWTCLALTMHVIRTPLHQAPARLPSSRSSRVLLCFWCLFTVVMTSAYTGNLMASLTVSVEEVPFSNLQELVGNDDYKIGVFKDNQMEEIFKTSEIKIFKDAWKKIQKFQKSWRVPYEKDLQYHTELISAGGYAVITTKKIANEIMSKECNVKTMKEMILPLSSGFVFPRSSPLTNIFSEQMRIMVEAGLVNHLEKKWTPEKKICYLPTNLKAQSVNVDMLFSAIVLALVGIGTALTALTMELVSTYMKGKL